MVGILVQGVIILFVWVGAWGIMEIMIDYFAKENQKVRLAFYSILLLLAVFIYWIAISII